MKIMMMTNTFAPHVGGVARSVSAFASAYRERGHDVLVVAPEFDGTPEREENVVRIPAIQNFNGSDFSVQLPIPGILWDTADQFAPDVVHSHHPFLLGGTALGIAARLHVPIVFTHHTMYEQYTHYVPGDSSAMKRFAIKLATGYANLCDHVVAPSESVQAVLQERGVTSPITVVPTGVDVERFAKGNGRAFRRRIGFPPRSFVVGHLGRLAPEKNLQFLSRAVAPFLWRNPEAYFLVIGNGPSKEELSAYFEAEGMAERLRFGGTLQGPDLMDAYHAMDVFAFASKSETQGIVLVEAMAAGKPVVALDAPGAREVVRDGKNGFLISSESVFQFAEGLQKVRSLSFRARHAMARSARNAASEFSMDRCAGRALGLYQSLTRRKKYRRRNMEGNPWSAALRMLKVEWDHLQTLAGAAGAALWESTEEGADSDD